MPDDHAPMAAKVEDVGCPWQAFQRGGEVLCEGWFSFWVVEIAMRLPVRHTCMGPDCKHYAAYKYELALRAKLSKEIEELKTQLRKEASRRSDTTDYVREAPRTPA